MIKFKLLLSSLFIATSMNAQISGNEEEPNFDGKQDTYFCYDDQMYVNHCGYTMRSLLDEQVYFLENDVVYLREFIDFTGFIKGKIDKTKGTITIKNGQKVKTKQFNGSKEFKNFYFAALDATTKQPLEGEFILTYTDKGNGQVCVDGGSQLFALYYLEAEKPVVFLHTKGLSMVKTQVQHRTAIPSTGVA